MAVQQWMTCQRLCSESFVAQPAVTKTHFSLRQLLLALSFSIIHRPFRYICQLQFNINPLYKYKPSCKYIKYCTWNAFNSRVERIYTFPICEHFRNENTKYNMASSGWNSFIEINFCVSDFYCCDSVSITVRYSVGSIEIPFLVLLISRLIYNDTSLWDLLNTNNCLWYKQQLHE